MDLEIMYTGCFRVNPPMLEGEKRSIEGMWEKFECIASKLFIGETKEEIPHHELKSKLRQLVSMLKGSGRVIKGSIQVINHDMKLLAQIKVEGGIVEICDLSL